MSQRFIVHTTVGVIVDIPDGETLTDAEGWFDWNVGAPVGIYAKAAANLLAMRPQDIAVEADFKLEDISVQHNYWSKQKPVERPICANCETRYTDEGEWVMDTYACPNDEGYCLNCCGCPEHEVEFDEDPHYLPAKEAN